MEEAVLAAALALLERLGWAMILVADRRLGRKELLMALVAQGRDLAIRVDPDITVYTAAQPEGALLVDVLAAQPDRGEGLWDGGQEGTRRCQARTVTATIHYSRRGRQHDSQAATLHLRPTCAVRRPYRPTRAGDDPPGRDARRRQGGSSGCTRGDGRWKPPSKR